MTELAEQGTNDPGTLMRARQALEEAATRTVGDDEPTWLAQVQSAARALFLVIEQHQQVAEEEEGTLVDATAQKPGLMSLRRRLEHEHADMLHRLSEIDVEVERQIASQDFNIDLVRLEAQVVRDILLLHVVRTDSLVFDAYFQVEGGEGG